MDRKKWYQKKAFMLLIDVLLCVLLVWFDQFTKGLAISRLKGRSAYSLIDGVLELQYLENHGMAFGMLQNQKVFILFVGVIFMLVLLFFLLKMPESGKFRDTCADGVYNFRGTGQYVGQNAPGLCGGLHIFCAH